MKRQEVVERYFKDRETHDKHPRTYPFVTISRQAGAGGHTLGELLMERIHDRRHMDLFQRWKLFDKELAEAMAREPDLDVSMESLVSEEYVSSVSEFISELFGNRSSQYIVYKRLFQLERIVAGAGKVILIGRGSSLVTRGMRSGIRVRLVAPVEVREQRVMELLHISADEAHDMVKKHDRERARFVKDFFSRDVNDPALYDQVWDTATLSFDEMADMLVEAIEEKHEVLMAARPGR